MRKYYLIFTGDNVLHIYIFGKHVVKGDVGEYRLKTNRLPPSPKAAAGQGRLKERRVEWKAGRRLLKNF